MCMYIYIYIYICTYTNIYLGVSALGPEGGAFEKRRVDARIRGAPWEEFEKGVVRKRGHNQVS